MPQTPDTVAYLVLGLAAVALIFFVLVASIVIRYRNLRRDAETIAALDDEP